MTGPGGIGSRAATVASTCSASHLDRVASGKPEMPGNRGPRRGSAAAPAWTGEWYSFATCQPSDTAAQTRALPDAGRTGPVMPGQCRPVGV